MRYLYKFFVPLLLISAFVIQGCSNEPAVEKKIRIAISKEYKAKNYSNWLNRYHNNVEWFNMYPLGIDSALQLLESCDGLLVTGGEDVFPGVYGKLQDVPRCGSIDQYRDSLEFALIAATLDDNKPLIGVCRGEQILNIHFGGTLHIDIPADFDTTIIHRQKDWRNCFHPVQIMGGTLLQGISEMRSGDVTSNHHQGIEILGQGLLISAFADDGLPEAIEWKDPQGKGFLMAVQWHPERMDTLHPLSAPIAKKFIKEAAAYRKNR